MSNDKTIGELRESVLDIMRRHFQRTANHFDDRVIDELSALIQQQVTKGKLEELKLVDDLLPNLWTPPYRSYKVEDMVKIEKHISRRADELQQQLNNSGGE